MCLPALPSPTILLRSLICLAVSASLGRAQSARDTVVELTAVPGTGSPWITLNWNSGSNVTAQKFWRRVKGSASWGTAIDPGAGTVSYADTAAQPGVAYEFSFQRSRSTAPATAYGSLVAGSRIPLIDQRGDVILLVDRTVATPLAPELSLLERNLAGDGWVVHRHDVDRSAISPASTNSADYAARLAEVQAVRSIVQSAYQTAPGTGWALIIAGRVPVPYSGVISPDGHPDHSGAWPTDAYYADVDGTWADASANNSSTTLSDTRNRNVAGDGKFDPSFLPSNVELQAGRIDFANMTSAPGGFTETTLLRQYLARNHQFRRGLGPYAAVQRRALVDDNFGYFSGEAFAASGYRNGIAFFGRSAGQIDALDWFGTLGATPVLFAYGCGSGSFSSASGIGTTAYDFSRRDSKAVFCQLFGSYFGDWDATNNFLRAALCGTQESLGLASMWAGRGYVHLAHMALGETLGYGVRYTLNNLESTFSGGWHQNGFTRSIHQGLLGDPTLRLHTVRPPSHLTAVSGAGGVTLTWQASPDAALGYHVYSGSAATGPFTRITGSPPSADDLAGSPLSPETLTCTDASASAGPRYYLVKAVKLETSAAGSYVNTSVGELAEVEHLAPAPAPAAPTGLAVTGTGSTSYALVWQDNATDEIGYEVERRNPSTGAWDRIATPGAGASSWADPAAHPAQINHYRVRAVNANGASPYTPPAAQWNVPGIADVKSDFRQVNVTAGSAALALRRFSGSHGDVSMNYATQAVLGTAGVDFTATSGKATWAHGMTGDFVVDVPIPQPAGPQLTKIFRLNISTPAGGLGASNGASTWVQIGDPSSQTLPSPWLSAAPGATGAGYSEQVSGTFGSTVRSGDISGTADACRLIYRPLSGDCRVTARVVYLSGMTSGRAGVMIRETSAVNSRMCAILLQSGNTARRVYRNSPGGTADTALTQSGMPVNPWLRATRAGSTVAVEYSSNGTTWTALGAPVTVTSPGTAILAGLVIAGNNTGMPEAWGYARWDNVEFLPAPLAPASLTAASTPLAGQVALSWPACADASEYRVERSAESGAGFAEIATTTGTTYTDTGVAGGQTWYYRVRSANAAFASGYSPETSATPLTPVDAWRLGEFGSSANTGTAADDADYDGDGLPNLIEYALGQPPRQAGATGTPAVGRSGTGAGASLTLTFARRTDAAGVALWVDAAASPAGPWSALDPLDPANQVSVRENTPAPGWQTLTIKDPVPMPGAGARFLRLRATRL